jgi:hypothetical protein
MSPCTSIARASSCARFPALRARHGVGDRGLARAGAVLGDERGQPPRLGGAGGQVHAGHRAPDRLRQAGEDLQPYFERDPQVVQRWSEPFQQHRAALVVGLVQLRAALAAAASQHGDLVLRVIAGARDHQLQHRRRAVGPERLRDVRLGAAGVRPAGGDLPVPLQPGHQRREPVQPGMRAGRLGLGADHRGHLDHARDGDTADTRPRRNCVAGPGAAPQDGGTAFRLP